MAEITWIKLKTDMFDNDKIKLIEALPDKDAIIVIWVKLLAAAGKANCNGYIMLTENIAMNIEEMATIFNRPLNTVRLAIETFRRYGMIEMDEGDSIRIKNWDVHQNIEGMDRVKQLNAKRNREYRERKKQQALAAPKEPENTKSDVSVTSRMTLSDDTETDLDLDKDLELDIDKDIQQTVGQSNDVQKLNNFFTTRLNRFPSEQLREDINFYLETYNDADLIIEAFNRSLADGRVKAKEKYALGTLRNWKHEGVTSIELLAKKEAQQLAGNQHGTTKGQRTTESEFGVNVGF